MIYTPHQILLGWSTQGGSWVRHMAYIKRKSKHIGFCLEKLDGKRWLKHLDVDGMIILK